MVLLLLGILVSVAFVMFLNGQRQMILKSKMSELPSFLMGVKVAEEYYKETHARKLAIEPYPAAPSAVARTWENEASGGFDTLGVTPMGTSVYGSYWVEVSEDGQTFTAHGAADIDGDGVRASYAATHEKGPELVTPKDVF